VVVKKKPTSLCREDYKPHQVSEDFFTPKKVYRAFFKSPKLIIYGAQPDFWGDNNKFLKIRAL